MSVPRRFPGLVPLVCLLFLALAPSLYARGQAQGSGGRPPAGPEAGTGPSAPADQADQGALPGGGETGDAVVPAEDPEDGENGDGTGEAGDGDGEAGDGDGEAAEGLSPEEAILEMDIKTSTLMELADWCRILGLSEGGTKEELAGRLRDYYGLPPPDTTGGGGEEGEGGRIITIEAARTTEYFTLEVVDEEYARLRGDVVVSLKDGEAVHRIKAWEILYNRTRNIMTASGGVEYVKTEGDVTETFKGESITVNLDNWAGVFMEGASERSVTAGETAYRFAGTLMSRGDQGVTVLTRAKITNAVNEEAYWSLDASKLWLLPGSDWAVFNAVLKVGEVPVLYIPFFFYPADEIIFHPVLGYRSREGNFVQTTTYILGRPKATTLSESSLTRTLGAGSDEEKVREGIFLRSTGRKSRDPNDTRLSVIFDAYTNLGIYLGTDLALPQKRIFGATDLSGGIGFTRDIHQIEPSYYTPFARFDGTSDWNRAYLFSNSVPYRYRLNTKGSMSGKYGSMFWNFPFYSDPYVDRDFLNRSEIMDWGQLIRGEETAEENLRVGVLGAYEWRINGSSTPPLPALAPYITNLSLSSMATTVAFRTRASTAVTNGVSPSRTFYYPDRFTIYSISSSISGTPLSLGGPRTLPQRGDEREDPLADIGSPRPPWGFPAGTGTPGADPLSPPALSQRFDIPAAHGPRFSIDYRLNPSGAMDLQFRAAPEHWREVEDIDWREVSSVLSTYRTDSNVAFTLADNTPLFTNSLRFLGTMAWQDYSFMDKESEEFDTPQEVDAANLRIYNSRYFTTSSEYTAVMRPLYQNSIWGNSSLQYTLRGLLAKSVFNGTALDPRYDVELGNWNREDIETHQTAVNITASVMDKPQTLLITNDLWPELPTLGGDATVRIWKTETNARGKILDPYNEETRIYDPLYFTEILRFTPKHSVQQYIVYDPELKDYTTLTSSLVLGGFTAAYTMTRSQSYDLVENEGWILSPEPEKLNPRELKLAYKGIYKKDSLWGNRLAFSFNVDTGLLFDLQRYTYSSFIFSFGVVFNIANFLDVALTATSENAVIYRYFQQIPFFRLPVEFPGEKNPLVDLFNSFRFDDGSLRRASGYKLKSFNLTLIHYLGDWNARLGITLSPYLDQTSYPYQYRFNNEISLQVQWVPVTEIQTRIYHNKDQFVIQ
ncbi:MAG: LPS-assembly protein LptD [Spirochaetaceae bacterium]|jgi:hypothetical protein|nr:LPS-assembly protein LptD [Spirochaetaceae bacterium]